ncbi:MULTISPECIES: sugar transferase [Mycolicibacter]|uniref:Sugar transferase n=1 Tax=[Mycobacterium] vasticus TaxID=2875777 RepID=A0ABU5YVJ1_9MYCO|nr:MULTISPECIES: sugar transferase [unclassified Mycolicibacter]MEB3061538.1 sugar transferase [Mycolicibacter sp. MYC101]MEB3067783.1 sugar transferase [Mycolicibacter sp. MYC017]
MTTTLRVRRPTARAKTDLVLPATAGGPARRWQQRYSVGLCVTDSVIICAAIALAQYLRFGESPATSGYPGQLMTLFSILFAGLWMAAIAVSHSRSPRIIGAGIDEYRRIASASFWTFGIIAMTTLLAKIDLARGYLAVALPVGTFGLLVGRNLWRRYIARKRARGRFQTMVVAIGDRPGVTSLAQELMRNPRDGYIVVGVGIPGYGQSRGKTILVEDRAIPILGDENHAMAALAGRGVDMVVITGTERFGASGLRKLMWRLENLDVDLVVAPGVMDVAESRLALRPVAGFSLLHVEKPRYHGAKSFQKRTFDFCFSLAALIGAAPVLAVVALAIKCTSRGPVFYPSERIGIDGTPFTMLKFRTMVDRADTQVGNLAALDEGAGVLFKIRDDPRVTAVGKVLRRFSIDELPQFINVLKQDMSVVGPRPPLRREVESYDGEVTRRLLVKPGVTGLWQVSGRSDLSWEEAVRLDLSYVDNWSMTADLLIIARTIRAVLSRDGAY